MSNRLDKDREAELQPIRIKAAVETLNNLGYTTLSDETTVTFYHKDQKITLYPYSGWFSGKGIKDGRGLANLIKQLKP